MLLALIFACIASVAAKRCENCVAIEGICHRAQYVLTMRAPFRKTVVISKMAIPRSGSRLYYVFEPELANSEYSKIGYINLDKRGDSGVITRNTIDNFSALDISHKNNVVYIGGQNGIYYLDADNKPQLIGAQYESIRDLIIHKGDVMFTKQFEDIIMKRKCGRSTYGRMYYKEYGNVKNFILDDNEYLVFLNNTGLYLNMFPYPKTLRLSSNAFFRGLTLDMNDVVYTWWIDHIYKVVIDRKNFEKSKLVEVATFEGLGAMAFDNNNNIVLNTGTSVVKLTLTDPDACS